MHHLCDTCTHYLNSFPRFSIIFLSMYTKHESVMFTTEPQVSETFHIKETLCGKTEQKKRWKRSIKKNGGALIVIGHNYHEIGLCLREIYRFVLIDFSHPLIRHWLTKTEWRLYMDFKVIPLFSFDRPINSLKNEKKIIHFERIGSEKILNKVS